MAKLVDKKRFELYLRKITALQEGREYSIAKSFIDDGSSSLVPALEGVRIPHGYGFVSIGIESCSPTFNDGDRLHQAYSAILTPSN